jgi:superfamily II DNA helicase RecQ
MNEKEVLEILLDLARGINPDTGEIFEDSMPYQSLRTTRALFLAIRALETNSNNDRHTLQNISMNIGEKKCAHDESIELAAKAEVFLPETQEDSSKERETGTEEEDTEVRKGFQIPPLDDIGQRLFERLKEWRSNISKEKGLPAYMVLSNKALSHISYLKPTSLDSLLEAHGVGTSKIDQYGDAILDIVSQIDAESNHDIINRDDDVAPF